MILYKTVSFKIAIIVGFLASIIVFSYRYSKNRFLSSFDSIGIFFILLQTTLGLLSKNSMGYFFSYIIENSIYLIIFAGSLFTKQDIISYIAKDYVGTEEIRIRCRPAFVRLTVIWSIFFAIKLLIKIIGITSFSFELLYGINWVMGTPLTIFLIWFSYIYPEKYFVKISSTKE